MPRSLSRRDTFKLGVAAAAITPFAVGGGSAHADPVHPPGHPSWPTRVFDVTDYGARGDGTTIDSDAINAAIEAAATTADKGATGGRGPGGTVYFPAGTYASFSIRLKSNVGLYFAPGATLLAATPANGKGYDPAEPGAGNNFQDFGHSHWHNSLIWGEGLQNVSITGPGVIDGQGLGTNDSPATGAGNKAIALKLCRNVVISDLTMLNGGHFCILATGVDNLRIDGLLIDTNRDGMDIDCCRNVRLSNCTVNSLNDDAIVFKSSYALGYARDVVDVTVTNCLVSGYDIGSVADGTYTRNTPLANDKEPPTGRIKCGTESDGGFKNITISNVVFDRCRGIALETVDGGLIEDVTISNITMRDTSNPPIFLRIGARLRGPAGITVGGIRRVNISDLVVHNADLRMPVIIAGIPGHRIEDVTLNNVRIEYGGGLTLQDAIEQTPKYVNTFFVPSTGPRPDPYAGVPEREANYPEPCIFGVLPAYGFYIRHATGIEMNNVRVSFIDDDTRPAFVFDDVIGADFHHGKAETTQGAPTFVLRNVADFTTWDLAPPVGEVHFDSVTSKEL